MGLFDWLGLKASTPQRWVEGELARIYRHKACAGETIVCGRALRLLASPILPPSLTECAACGKTDGTSEFIWTHTDESIPQAQDRIRRGLPLPLRILLSAMVLLTGLLLSIGVCVGVWVVDRWWTGLLAGFGCLTVISCVVDGVANLLALAYHVEFEQLV